MRVLSMIVTIDDDVDWGVVPIEERLRVEVLATIIMYFESDSIKEYNEMVNALYGRGT